MSGAVFPHQVGECVNELRTCRIQEGKYTENMNTAEKILTEIQELDPEDQSEVLDFVGLIKSKKSLQEEKEFKGFSLESAMRGMEDEEDLYDASDIRKPVK